MSLTPSDIIAIVQAGGTVEIDPQGAVRISPAGAKATRSERNRRYYERKEKRLYPPLREWLKLRGIVFSRDGHICTYCGSDGGGQSLHCDHIVPVSKGGAHTPQNLTTACKACNSSKKAEPVEFWRAKHGL